MTPVFFSSFIITDNTRKFLIFIKIYFDKVPSIVPLSVKTIVTPSLHTSFKLWPLNVKTIINFTLARDVSPSFKKQCVIC